MTLRTPMILCLAVTMLGCSANASSNAEPPPSSATTSSDAPSPDPGTPTGADVVSVEVQGETFVVGIHSPDTGCDRYADWWEVLDAEGNLVYRRILAHSHPGEQPFVRSGGPVEADPNAPLVVRAHMNPGGYSGAVMAGTIDAGFERSTVEPGFAADVESQPPQPNDCAF